MFKADFRPGMLFESNSSVHGHIAHIAPSQDLPMNEMTFSRPVPILRSFNEDKTKEFYMAFLGFRLDWEHRFEPNTPLYMQLSIGEAVIQISEHFGDGCPGARMRIEVNDVVKYCDMLNAKKYRHARPGYQLMPWGTVDMTIDDPSGNKITFFSDGRNKS